PHRRGTRRLDPRPRHPRLPLHVPHGQDRLGGRRVRDRSARHPPLHLHPHQEDPMSGATAGRGRQLGVTAARAVILAVVTVWTLFPIYYMLTLSFTPWSELFRPVYFVQHPTLENYRFVVFQESVFVKFFWRWLGNSLFISAFTMLVVLAVAALGSFALGRLRFGLGRFISGMTLFTYIIPASFLSIPFFKIMGDFDLLDTYWSVILAMTTFASPYALWVLWDYAKTIPPEIDESAAI